MFSKSSSGEIFSLWRETNSKENAIVLKNKIMIMDIVTNSEQWILGLTHSWSVG